MSKRKVPNENLECLVCGDFARGLNFDVISCMSCKTFFRRNVFRKSSLICKFEDKCSITKSTRGFCSSCRLKKCLKLGMDSDLIRIIPNRSSTTNANKQLALPTPQPLNLLQNDRSLLTAKEWNLISNFIHIYDDQNIREKVNNYLNHLHCLPAKLRSRATYAYEIISQFFYGIQPLIELTPDLNNLSVQARRVLTKNNLSSAGTLNGIFLSRELDLYDNPYFLNSCNIYYGQNAVLESLRIAHLCDPNGNLIKLFLFIIVFASNTSVVIYDNEEAITSEESSINLIRIQDIYVTILWKYFLYLYDYEQAIMRFFNMVKRFLNTIQHVQTIKKNDNHNLMVGTVTAEVERDLIR